jgi:hypothetical protein
MNAATDQILQKSCQTKPVSVTIIVSPPVCPRIVERIFKKFYIRFGTVFLRSVRRLLVTPNVVPSSPILVILMMEALRSSEASVLTKDTQCNIPEDGILHSHCRNNPKSYVALTGWAL